MAGVALHFVVVADCSGSKEADLVLGHPDTEHCLPAAERLLVAESSCLPAPAAAAVAAGLPATETAASSAAAGLHAMSAPADSGLGTAFERCSAAMVRPVRKGRDHVEACQDQNLAEEVLAGHPSCREEDPGLAKLEHAAAAIFEQYSSLGRPTAPGIQGFDVTLHDK